MAGAVKHMERSHRSHRTNYAAFNQFHRHAFKVSNAKEQRKTLGQRLSAMVKSMLPKTTSK